MSFFLYYYLTFRIHPVHDSDSILLVRSKHYYDNIEVVKNWYINEHDNWHLIEGTHSRWKIWNECKNLALYCTKQIQLYLSRIASGNDISSVNQCYIDCASLQQHHNCFLFLFFASYYKSTKRTHAWHISLFISKLKIHTCPTLLLCYHKNGHNYN